MSIVLDMPQAGSQKMSRAFSRLPSCVLFPNDLELRNGSIPDTICRMIVILVMLKWRTTAVNEQESIRSKIIK